MKLHTSRTTISCPTGFGFLPSGLYWSKIPKSCSQAWPLPMVKATLWKCQKQLCESPVLKWCPCTTLTASATHAHRAARTRGDAENLLLLLELSHRSSGTATSDVDSVPWHSCSRSPGLQHVLHLAGAHVEAKTFWAMPLCYTPARSFPALWVLSISKKQMHIWESTHTDTHFFSQPGPVDVFKSNRCDTLFGFVWKELEDQNREVQLACTY